MYPDSELLSAYLDGEVPSPWKEQLEERLKADQLCSSELDRLAAVRNFLHSEPQPDWNASRELVWHRLSNSDLQRRPQPLWRRRVVVPLPLVAAAASLLLLLAGALLWYSGRASADPVDLPVAAREMDLTIRIGEIGIDELLRMINETDTIGEVTVKLPDMARFDFIGEPQMMRAADFRINEPLIVPHLDGDDLSGE